MVDALQRPESFAAAAPSWGGSGDSRTCRATCADSRRRSLGVGAAVCRGGRASIAAVAGTLIAFCGTTAANAAEAAASSPAEPSAPTTGGSLPANGSAANGSAANGSAGEAYRLVYRFAHGETLRYRVVHSANVRTTIDGNTQQVESQTESTKVWKVTDVLPSGEMEFVHLVEAVKMVNQKPGGKPHRFDSTTDATPPPGFERAAHAVGIPLSVLRIRPNGEIAHREQKHPQPPATADMPLTLQLPDGPIRLGEKWDRTYDVEAQRKSGTQIQVRTRRLCKLTAVDHGLAHIDVTYQILSPVDAYVRSQLVERLTTGKVRFDIAAGRIVSQTHDVDARILGFAGNSSSMHFLARTEERMLPVDKPQGQEEKVAAAAGNSALPRDAAPSATELAASR